MLFFVRQRLRLMNASMFAADERLHGGQPIHEHESHVSLFRPGITDNPARLLLRHAANP